MFADAFSIVMIGLGSIFFFVGSIGLLRFPDVMCRLHALTKVDNLGLGFIVLGVLPQVQSLAQSVQIIIVWGLVMFSGVLSCYLVAQNAYKASLSRLEGDK